MKELPETHQRGNVTLDNIPELLKTGHLTCDLGVQIAKDGRIWLCINGISFLRFSPHPDGKMKKEPK